MVQMTHLVIMGMCCVSRVGCNCAHALCAWMCALQQQCLPWQQHMPLHQCAPIHMLGMC